ncbi:MAG: hypothetical protein ACI8PB_001755 [Desulforhopalus sp.]|jgi:hypothetical protein
MHWLLINSLMEGQKLYVHVNIRKGERSDLAELARALLQKMSIYESPLIEDIFYAAE